MKEEMVSLKIDPEIVRNSLDKRIQAAIVSQLGNTDELIGGIVSLALKRKVDRDGNLGRYDSDNKYDFLEAMASKSIRQAAEEALREWLDANKAKVKNAVLKELQKPSRQRSIAKSFADAVENSLECSWRMSCDIKFREVENNNRNGA